MWQECKDLQSYVVEHRRALHRIPEVGGDLPETQAYVIAELEKLGIPYVKSTGDSGIIASIQGGKPGKTVALRADMDALPIEEATGVSYASEHPGRMHACGHDTHMAMLLGTAKVLNAHRTELKGTVKLFFQTGEELAIGARVLVAEGCMDGVDAIFGLHIGNILNKEIQAGKLIAVPGCCMASFDKFVVHVQGKGCHGSTPEKGIDPISIAAHIVTGLQQVIAREISATRPSVMTIGMIHGGNQYNIIPNEVSLEGTIRALEEDVRQYMVKRIEEVSKEIAAAYNGTASFEIYWGAPPVINDADMAALAAKAAVRALGEEKVITSVPAPNMAGEDFAYYLEKAPGAFLFLSSSNPEKGTDVPHHNPRFNVDEDVLWEGPAAFVSIVEEFLGQ